MKITAIISYKGGTGKTVTTVNLAYDLAAVCKKRVLVVDSDPQAHLTYVLGRKMALRSGTYEYLKGKKRCIHRSCYPGIDLIPANADLEMMHCGLDAFQDLKELEGKYDHVLIDCHPSMQPVTIAALCAADYTIVPVKADRFSLNGMEVMRDYFSQIKHYNPELEFLGCLFTMYANRKSQKKILEEMITTLNYPFFHTVISYSEAVNSSVDARKALLAHRRNSPAAKDYLAFTEEFLERTNSYGKH